MERDNIMSAPQIRNVREAYRVWRQKNYGTFRNFLIFMTTPGPERDAYVSAVEPMIEMRGATGILTLG